MFNPFFAPPPNNDPLADRAGAGAVGFAAPPPKSFEVDPLRGDSATPPPKSFEVDPLSAEDSTAGGGGG
jgi:hypothetical protein